MMARYYDRFTACYEKWIAPRREELLSDVAGRVLEIGPGTGANLPYYPAGIRWIGLEPNRHMHAQLEARAREHGIDAECRVAGAEGIDLQDGSVDAVVGTLVLCSVPQPERVLGDVARVLRPGGRFLFIEHVAAPRGTGLRRVQRLVRPFWNFWADGCCPDRETDRQIRALGFAEVAIETFEMPRSVGPRFVATHVVGTARKV
jgi:SAM-dependent methyltransferase